MSKAKVELNDNNRVLLTDLLPYEVPLIFSNIGFYNMVSNNNFDAFKSIVRDLINENWTIPFNYEIRKQGGDDSRTLSVMHPLKQLDFVGFYQKYDNILLHLCSKSPFSLRHIHKVARFYYKPDMAISEDRLKSRDVEVEPEFLDEETRYLKSYFTYKPIDLIYKFYEGSSYQRLEQKFDCLLEFDVSKCFYNIYTHSIAWAVKGKKFAKENGNNKSLFENQFDSLMQKVNYNETNGILVGPEVSRIFAEIILQQVDLDVIDILYKRSIKLGVDYEVRRYVDDVFVFSNDERVLDEVLAAYRKILEKYKLFVNDSKTKKHSRPFISNIAIAKREIRKSSFSLWNSIVEEIRIEGAIKLKLKSIRKPYSMSGYFIKDFQCIVKGYGLTYDVANRDVIRYAKSFLVRLIDNLDSAIEKSDLENFILLYLDVVFYVFSLDINVSSTYKLSQIIVILNRFLSDKEADLKHSLQSKVIKEVDLCVDIYIRKHKVNETNIEILNLLISMKLLYKEYRLPEQRIRQLFDLRDNVSSFDKLNYFQIVSLLFYMGNDSDYQSLSLCIKEAILRKFKSKENPFVETELMMLFFDYICCPFVSKGFKQEVVNATPYPKGDINKRISAIMKMKQWFTCWDSNIDLERILKQKEWSSVY